MQFNVLANFLSRVDVIYFVLRTRCIQSEAIIENGAKWRIGLNVNLV